MKCSLGIWWFGLGVLSVILACGGNWTRRAISSSNEILSPADSGLDRMFPKPDRGDVFPDRVSLLDERRKKTLEADCKEIELAAPDLDPKFLLRYKKIRESMIASQGQFFWDGLKREELLSSWDDPAVLKAIPEEFSLYVEGAIAYRRKDIEKATKLWQELLKLPAEKRKYRSVWAAWMLARCDKENSVQWYDEVEKLVDAGFADSLGVTQDREAWRIYFGYRSGECVPALKYYIAQGKEKKISSFEAANSLRTVLDAGLAHNEEKVLKEMLESAELRMVLCRYLEINCGRYHYNDQGREAKVDEATRVTMEKWGKLLKEEGGDFSAEAAVMAACCYRNMWFDQAKAWLKLVKTDTDDSLFVRAKLAVRAGNYAEAQKFYQKLVVLVDPKGKGGAERWYVPSYRGISEEGSRVFAAYSEYACILLARKQFKEALLNFDRGGDTADAAYVAESLLTANELMSVVSQHYPEAGRETSWVRRLLGRRLAREYRFKEAKKYLPESSHQRLDIYAKVYQQAHDKTQSREERAQQFEKLAVLHLDYSYWLFRLENGCRPESRVIAAGLPVDPRYKDDAPMYHEVLKMTPEEKSRFRKHFRRISPHHVARYDAAEYLYQGAKLLPKNDDNAAVLMWKAGCLLKDGDPEAADKYYQALVRRFWKTELGKLADEKRWFPAGDWKTAW
ncbi:hypothetical protein SAMN02745181_2200 [Rubritalea squalenifaciens DSM 18772]|uniref:Tetratricopeptide repeat-containing protein n=1 Tax=Rubritalea squalenifaciens DSM 18772 TaxID=1123071 RepID=A0A1M6KT73_9BACT|nr:hypothetical protein [Rubritalea squalenifaciens]SHJ62205.1 hypothetical protein SAMN02745181_2200 [Rubritalea squalenifaciens DSM 18772]